MKDYLSGKFSQREVANKYELSNNSVLNDWVNKYNGHREIKAVTEGMSQSMTKGRATTWKERIEIVLYCITQSNNYQQAAEVYNVSYQQVYHWVKKYELGSENALKYRRTRSTKHSEP